MAGALKRSTSYLFRAIVGIGLPAILIAGKGLAFA